MKWYKNLFFNKKTSSKMLISAVTFQRKDLLHLIPHLRKKK